MSLESFKAAFYECAFWSTGMSDEEGNCLGNLEDTHGPEDLSDSARAELDKDCANFYEAHAHLWQNEDGYSHGEYDCDDMAGHDFWLTRNGHGAGFWDRGIENGDELTAACKPYGSVDLYVGDDGKVYC